MLNLLVIGVPYTAPGKQALRLLNVHNAVFSRKRPVQPLQRFPAGVGLLPEQGLYPGRRLPLGPDAAPGDEVGVRGVGQQGQQGGGAGLVGAFPLG